MDIQIVSVGVIAVLVLLVLGALAWMAMRQRRRQELRKRFGPEYQHVVEEEGDVGRAERVLAEREERIKKLEIRPLSDSARAQFVERWRKVQERFVDDPPGAVSDADVLIAEAMKARGYPVGDFEQRAADASVEHPDVVQSYRSAHGLATREQDVTTEDLRTAMVQYRELFSQLVEDGISRETHPEAKADTEAEPKTKADAEAKAESEAETNAEPEPEPEPETQEARRE